MVAVGMLGWVLKRIFAPSRATPSVSANLTPSVSANLNSVSDSNVAIGNDVSQQIVHYHHVPDRPSDALKATEPSPRQIVADLKALPPFERHRAEKNYQGLSVLWPLTLLEVHLSGDTWGVILRGCAEPHSSPSPIVDANFTELPPEIRVSPTNTLIWVRGRIRDSRYFNPHQS